MKKKNFVSDVCKICAIILFFAMVVLMVIYAQRLGDNIHLLLILPCCAIFFTSLIINVILHEFGHLLFGLLTGYHFISFRIFNLTIIKEQGKLKLKSAKFDLGGQCLMIPPDRDKTPWFWYNIGGVIMNKILFIIFLVLAFTLLLDSVGFILICVVSLTSYLVVVSNGIPLKTLPNDMGNIVNLFHSSKTKKSFVNQLKIVGFLQQGGSYSEIPQEWLQIEKNIDFNVAMNQFFELIKVDICYEVLDFDGANKCFEQISEKKYQLSPFYKFNVDCEKAFLSIIGIGNQENINFLYDAKNIKTINSQIKGKNITKIRLMYAFNLLHNHDLIKAVEMQGAFEKATKSFPYVADIESEKKIMAYIKNLHDSKEKNFIS